MGRRGAGALATGLTGDAAFLLDALTGVGSSRGDGTSGAAAGVTTVRDGDDGVLVALLRAVPPWSTGATGLRAGLAGGGVTWAATGCLLRGRRGAGVAVVVTIMSNPSSVDTVAGGATGAGPASLSGVGTMTGWVARGVATDAPPVFATR